MNGPHAIIQYAPHWVAFDEPGEIIVARTPSDVMPALHAVQQALDTGWAATGFLTYEAAAGFDPALCTHPRDALPLLRFTLHRDWQVTDRPPLPPPQAALDLRWEPQISRADYTAGINRIREWIARGETYQVNYTTRLQAPFRLDPAAWFHHLWLAQRPSYAALIQGQDFVISSVSPELFFDLQGDVLTCRPMKGTAARGRTWAEDEQQAQSLQQSHKNRAENVMIVDMIRNDLGRIAPPGKVQTTALFEIERYPTVLQMTSTIQAQSTAGLPDIMGALFPSASITGAPKVHTMKLIRELEPQPREIYTGTIGAWWPTHPVTRQGPRHARFNVAIRTAQIDTRHRIATYGTGGGIVWDSDPAKEYAECQTKALVLQAPSMDWSLFETLRWRPASGWFLKQAHLDRIAASAAYWGWPDRRAALESALDQAAATFSPTPQRVRLQYSACGEIDIDTVPLDQERHVLKVALAAQPVADDDIRLFHKSTRREPYNQARARQPGVDDVLLWNERGELTEFTIANVFVRMGAHWYTPPVDCGLLNGTLRATLVRRGRVKERVIYKHDLKSVSDIVWGNSVRGFRRVRLEDLSISRDNPKNGRASSPSEPLSLSGL